MKSSNQTLKNQYTNLLLQQDETSLKEASYYPTLSVGAGMDYSNTWTQISGTPIVGNQAVSPYGNIRLSYDIQKRCFPMINMGDDGDISKVFYHCGFQFS